MSPLLAQEFLRISVEDVVFVVVGDFGGEHPPMGWNSSNHGMIVEMPRFKASGTVDLKNKASLHFG